MSSSLRLVPAPLSGVVTFAAAVLMENRVRGLLSESRFGGLVSQPGARYEAKAFLRFLTMSEAVSSINEKIAFWMVF